MPGLGLALAAYFDPAEDFPGMSFSSLGRNPAGEVTADDLLAVSLLDIAWRPEAVRHLLGSQAAEISGMLADIRADLDLWDASDADLAAVERLWAALIEVPGVGGATAAKLLARKRLRLCPATDRAAIRAVGVPGQTWETMRYLLRDPERPGRTGGAAAAGRRPGEPAAHPGRGDLDRARHVARGPAGADGRARPGRLSRAALSRAAADRRAATGGAPPPGRPSPRRAGRRSAGGPGRRHARPRSHGRPARTG